MKVERESQFNTADGSEFQVRGAAVLNDRVANDVRRNGTHSSGTDDDRMLRALVRNEMCWLRYCGDINALQFRNQPVYFINLPTYLTDSNNLTVEQLFHRCNRYPNPVSVN